MNIDEIDSSALKAAFESGDEAAVQREWEKWIAKLLAAAENNPAFGAWLEEFRADQERLLRWEGSLATGKIEPLTKAPIGPLGPTR